MENKKNTNMRRIIMAICLMLMSVLCFGSNNNVKINKEECCINKMVRHFLCMEKCI